MTEHSLPFGPGALIVFSLFLIGMLSIGCIAYFKRRDETLDDFYLAGRTMGFGVLLLTLYATQYSGNTLMGFTGAAYRSGLGFLVCTHFMTAIVVAYLLFAPALYQLSREHRFITPGDFIYHRFKNHALRIIVTLLMIYALCNFTLAQMKTLGTAFAGISQGKIPMWAGVLGLLGVMLIYETLGGMRSVAWTDVVQGMILFTGFFFLIGIAWFSIGDLPSAISKLTTDPYLQYKVQQPGWSAAPQWWSFVLMVGLGGAIYPQAIQRVYSAKTTSVLKKSLAVMGFLPLATTLVAVSVGVIMAAFRPGLETLAEGQGIVPSETVLSLLCLEIMTQSEFGYWLVVFVVAALLAAIMSTTDSALLSISSMVTQDLYCQYIRPKASQKHLTRVGRRVTWILMIPVAWLALDYQGTLIQLLQLKFELLIQCVPAIYCGVHWKGLRAPTVLTGIIVGLSITLWLTFMPLDSGNASSEKTFFGVHPGIIGLVINLLICSLDRLRTSNLK